MPCLNLDQAERKGWNWFLNFLSHMDKVCFKRKRHLQSPSSSLRAPCLAASRVAWTSFFHGPLASRKQVTSLATIFSLDLCFPQRKESASRLSSNGIGIHLYFGHFSQHPLTLPNPTTAWALGWAFILWEGQGGIKEQGGNSNLFPPAQHIPCVVYGHAQHLI